jgi:PAS domain S-box-containing protein
MRGRLRAMCSAREYMLKFSPDMSDIDCMGPLSPGFRSAAASGQATSGDQDLGALEAMRKDEKMNFLASIRDGGIRWNRFMPFLLMGTPPIIVGSICYFKASRIFLKGVESTELTIQTIEQSELLASVGAMQTLIAFMVMAAVLALLFVLIFAGHPARPLNRDLPSLRGGDEKEIEEERTLLRQVIDAFPGFISVKDENGRFRLANRALAAACGATADELVGKTARDFNLDEEGFSRAQRDNMEVIRCGKEKLTDSEPFTFADRTVHMISEYKAPLFDPDGRCRRVLTVGTYITGRKEADFEKEKRFIQARKWEARRIVHDFNNILMGLQSHISILLYDLSPDHPHRRKLENMERYISRGADLTKQMLKFAKAGGHEDDTDLLERSPLKHRPFPDAGGMQVFQIFKRTCPEYPSGP